jgi:hypothetical protein
MYIKYIYQLSKPTINTVKKPVVINVSVATSERTERLPKPHTPCPLVQPEPHTVPKPTNKPATSNKLTARDGITGAVNREAVVYPPTIKPIKKGTRQALSLGLENNKPDKIPLIPAIRPIDESSNQLAQPINTPPNKGCSILDNIVII